MYPSRRSTPRSCTPCRRPQSSARPAPSAPSSIPGRRARASAATKQEPACEARYKKSKKRINKHRLR